MSQKHKLFNQFFVFKKFMNITIKYILVQLLRKKLKLITEEIINLEHEKMMKFWHYLKQ